MLINAYNFVGRIQENLTLLRLVGRTPISLTEISLDFVKKHVEQKASKVTTDILGHPVYVGIIHYLNSIVIVNPSLSV